MWGPHTDQFLTLLSQFCIEYLARPTSRRETRYINSIVELTTLPPPKLNRDTDGRP